MRSYYHKQLLVRLLLFFAGMFCYAARQEWLEPGNEAWQGRIFRLLLWAGVFLDILKKFSLPEGSAWERKSCLPVVTARRTVPLSV